MVTIPKDPDTRSTPLKRATRRHVSSAKTPTSRFSKKDHEDTDNKTVASQGQRQARRYLRQNQNATATTLNKFMR